jgi:hypothetical protein
MGWNHLSSVMPLPGPDPWMAGTSPAMTPSEWFNMEGSLSATLKDHDALMKLIARRLGPRGGAP